MRVLILDNYDSFTYNLAQYIGELGAEPIVHRNDVMDAQAALALEPDRLVISPGPGRPEDAGVCRVATEQAGLHLVLDLADVVVEQQDEFLNRLVVDALPLGE